MTKDITITNGNNQLSNPKSRKELEIELANALSDQGLDMKYASEKLKDAIDNALSINAKGDTIEDHRTRLKGLELLFKLVGFDLGQKKTQIAIFNNVPKPGDKLDF